MCFFFFVSSKVIAFVFYYHVMIFVGWENNVRVVKIRKERLILFKNFHGN